MGTKNGAVLLAAVLGLGACAHAKKKEGEAGLEPVPTVARPEVAKPDGRATEFAKTKVQILDPKPNAVVAGPDVSVKLAVDGYAIGNGPHLHLILDNEP